ncbi:MAG TPA: sensor histidine kinase [Bacteroidales bacterium]
MKKTLLNISVFICVFLLQFVLFFQTSWASKSKFEVTTMLVQNDYSQNGGNQDKLKQLITQALSMEKLGNFNSASPLFDSALKIAQSNGNDLLINYLKRKKGVRFANLNQLDSAKIYFLSVEEYCRQNGVDSLLADVQLNLGHLANQEGKPKVCLDYYQSALELYEKEKDTLGIAGVMNNYSLFYKESGDFDKALENAIISLKLFLKCNETYLYVGSILNLGNIYEKLGEYDTALAKYEESYQLSITNKYPKFINSSLINRAVIFYRQEKYAEAEVEFKRAIENADKNKDKSLLALLYSNLGIAYRNQGKNELALESYQQALQIAKEIDDEARLETIFINLGYLYKDNKKYSEAIQYYNMSLELAIKRNEKADIETIYENLADIFEETGDYKRAYSYLSLANQYHDSLLNIEKVRAIEEMKAKYEKEKNMAQIKSLQDENKINDLEKKSIRSERNTALGFSSAIVVLLIIVIFFFRMKARKNRIIDAQRIQQLEDEKKLLAAQSVILGQENERKRIAQELHDGIGVLLSTASIHFSVASKATKDEQTIEMFDKAKSLLTQAGGEVRKISQNMMPVVLSKFGLYEALEDMFEKLDDLEDIEVTSSFSGSREKLPENTEIMLYRIIQEMVNNTLKHANATSVEFSFSRGNGAILIDYKDDGIGFDLNNLPHNSSLGIYGIQSRVDFLKGIIKIETKPGTGTYYHISIPAKK